MKKILALVLALAMALSVGAFAGFSDVPVTDPNAATYELLAGLKIIGGYDDGTFGGGKTVTRAEAAAFLYRMAEGKFDANELKGPVIYNGKVVTDCDANAWYTGYINWAITKGIMAGDPAGTFRPNDSVSVAELTKMAVVVLGYSANNFTFPYGFMSQGRTLGLLKNVTDTNANTKCIRANVAVLTANALTAKRISYIKDPNGQYQTQPVNSFLVDVFGAIAAESYLTGTSSINATGLTKENQIALSAARSGGSPVAFDYAGDVDDYIGAKMNIWYQDKDAGATLTAGDKVLAVAPLATEKIAFVKASDLTAKGSDFTFKVDGTTYTTTGSDAIALSLNAPTTMVSDKSNAVYKMIINTADNKVAVYSSLTYVYKISAINAKTGDVTFDVPAAGVKTVVDVDSVTGGDQTTAKGTNVAGYEGMKKGDIVYVLLTDSIYKDKDGKVVNTPATVCSLMQATIVPNVKVTAKSTGDVYSIGGKDYKIAADKATTPPALGSSYDLIMSPNGYITAAVSVGVTTNTVYGVVTNFGATAANSGLLATYKDHTITVMTGEGKEVTYPVKNATYGTFLTKDKPWTASSTATNYANVAYQPVILTVNTEGAVTNIEAMKTAVAGAGANTNKVSITANGVVTALNTATPVSSWTLGADSAVFYIKDGGASGAIANTTKVEVKGYKGSAVPATDAVALTNFDGATTGARAVKYAVITAAPTTAAVSNNGFIQWTGEALNSANEVINTYKATYQGKVTNFVSATKVSTTAAAPVYGTIEAIGETLDKFTVVDLSKVDGSKDQMQEVVAAASEKTLVLVTDNLVLPVASDVKVFNIDITGTAGNYAYKDIKSAATIADVKADAVIDYALNTKGAVSEIYILTDVD